MTHNLSENLTAEIKIALAYTPQKVRERLRIFFAFDHRLGRIVAGTKEPILGQMRLAWWRDMLGKPASERPQGNDVLDAIARHWGRDEAVLIELVNGWEHMIGDGALSSERVKTFALARTSALLSVFEGSESSPPYNKTCEAKAYCWALADLAAKVSSESERELIIKMADQGAASAMRVPREARGLAVLGALAARAISKGGGSLMDGRSASLIAMKAAIYRR